MFSLNISNANSREEEGIMSRESRKLTSLGMDSAFQMLRQDYMFTEKSPVF